jgi:predicted DNA-binding protein (UPF0251 family)
LCGRSFKPAGIPMTKLRKIDLLRDELETLKLCDMEGLTQEQAGQKMGISRGTVQRILTRARQKVAEALVTGAALVFREDSPEVQQLLARVSDLRQEEETEDEI